MSLGPGTIVEMFWQRVAESATQPAIFFKERGEFVSRTWQQLADDSLRVAAELEKLGIGPGDRVAQVSENRYDWLLTDLAVLLSGAVHVPIHAPLTGPQILWQVRDSAAKLLIVSNAAQLAKLQIVAPLLPKGLLIRSHDRCAEEFQGRPVELLLPDRTAAVAPAARNRVQQLAATIQPNDLASILYTSGTTGQPRGVMLSQRNLAFNAWGTLEAFAPYRRDRRLNFLPLSHIFARTCDWYVTICGGSEMGIAEARETVLDDCQKFHPNVLNGVPYFFDKVRKTLLEDEARDQRPRSLQDYLGKEIRLCNSGGAALPDYVFDFYQARGIALRQGYGLTESSPVISLSTEERFRRGSVGKAIPGVEIRIAADEEIETKGPHVMLGYLHDAAATAAVMDKHWLRTGDQGRIDEDGFLFVTGRKKELIVLASGKKVQPTEIESQLTADPLILQAFVVGDGRNYLTALLVPNPELLKKKIRKHWLWVFSKQQALRHPRVRSWFAEIIERQLADRAPWEHVKKFVLMPRGFTIESGELTPKLSLRRKEIEQNCQAEIASLYQ